MQAADTPVRLTNVVMTQYTPLGNGVGQYIMLIGTGDYTVDEDLGIYRTSDDGYMATITLYANEATGQSIALPDGTYALGDGQSVGTWSNAEGLNVLTAYTRSTNNTQMMTPTEGTLTVSHDDASQTQLTGQLTADGQSYTLSFDGTLMFQGEGSDDRIHDPINTTFVGGQALYIGDEFGYGMVRLELWDQEANEEGTFPDGTNLFKPVIYVPQVNYETGSFSSLPEGTYEVGYSAGDFVALPGYDDGQSLPTGSYVAVTSNSLTRLGMIDAGTMTIKKGTGNTYEISIDFTTAEGVAVGGQYSGRLDFMDISGSNSGMSTLTDDMTLDYSGISEIECRDFGDVYQVGLRAIDLRWIDTEQLVGTTVELLLPWTESFEGVPTGTFPVAAAGSYEGNTLFPGLTMGTYTIGTWGHIKYGYTTDGQLGVDMNDVGPAAGGEVTISRDGELYTVIFDLTDDAKQAHRMSGTWTGRINDGTTGLTNRTATTGRLTLTPAGLSAPGLTTPVDLAIYDTTGRCVARYAAWQGEPVMTSQLPRGIYVARAGSQVLKFVR